MIRSEQSSAPALRRLCLLLLASLLALCLQGCRLHPSAPVPTTAVPTAPSAAAKPETSSSSGQTAPADPDTPTEPETTAPPALPAEDESWKLILVNADHPLPEGFTVELKQLRNGMAVDERIYPELQQMFDDAREEGIYPFINESFRTAERQQQIMDKYIANYMATGLRREAAEKKARQVVALPGTSEHQLGLAVDLIGEYGNNEATWAWLKENCWRYGFILRYPGDKTAVTGISNEPWHFRYVGVPTAQEITESGLCLEESLAQQGR